MTTSGSKCVFYVYEHWRLDRDECFYLRGVARTEEFCAKISAAKKVWWDVKRAENGGVIVGPKITDAGKAALSKSKKEWWARRKLERV